MSIQRIEFYDAVTSTLIKTVMPVPASPFEVCFDTLSDDQYIEVFAIAYFDSGAYTVASTPKSIVVNETSLVDFAASTVKYLTTETSDVESGVLDLTEVTQFTVDKSAVGKFVFEYKKTLDVSYTSADVVTPDNVANTFTVDSPEIDTTDEDAWICRWKWVDSKGDESEWTYRYIVKNLYVGVDNDGTDAWCWDNAGADKVLY